MEKLWFRSKSFGWGWQPCTWQGWIITLVYIVILLYIGFSFSSTSEEPTQKELILFFVKILGLTALMLAICWKTGEWPKWRWGCRK
ncbi:hypothetical protein KKD88_00755 [Patescibacteria group bacterium]|nr:hypothetical protein [Patescibacteria group bacterium]MBU1034181.1 hypothetical protein [Patescibacteria group bacterium]MBU1629590.1 hypothetical protein [Patescibacteria group bacterium]